MKLFAELAAYQPQSEQEGADQKLILSLCNHFSDTILTRGCKAAHLTASGMLLNPTRDHVLMVYHNIYQSWSWTGGHADGDSDLLGVAMREAQEETGILQLRPLTRKIASLDILTVQAHYKHGCYVSPHLHLSVSYLLEAPMEQALSIKPDENSKVGWLPVCDLKRYCTEMQMLPLYQKLIERARTL
ncbi:MAG: NUDIX hydrolase [Anaerotruncus sp.]|nr:NUDIX hydrolase [Anaerotruncus sp.]